MTGEEAALREAVREFRAVVDNARDPDASAWSNLGAALQMLADRSGDATDRAEAVQVSQHAVDLTAPSDPERLGRLSNLALGLSELGIQRKDRPTLERAVAVAAEAAKSTPPGTEDSAARVTNLAVTLQALYDLTGEVELLHQAVTLTREAARGVSTVAPGAEAVWANHAAALNALFQRDRDPAVLPELVNTCVEALSCVPGNAQARVVLLGNLGLALLNLYEVTDEADLLAAAEQATRQGIDAAGLGSNRYSLLSNLCTILRTRFGRDGNITHLDEAVEAGRSAVAGLDPQSPHLVAAMANLSLAADAAFGVTGDIDLLHEAVAAGDRAVRATSPDHPEWPGRLSNYGIILRNLFERTRDPQVAVSALTILRRAADASSGHHPHHPAVLSSLVLMLRSAGQAAGDAAMIDEARRASDELLATTAVDDPDRPGRLSNHMIILRSVFAGNGDEAALDEAVIAGREAIGRLDGGHAQLSMIAANLGLALSTLATVRADDEMLAEAADNYQLAAREPAAPVLLRIWSHRARASLAAERGRLEEAMAALEEAVDLMPRLAGRWLDRDDRDHEMSRINGFAAQIAGISARCGRAERGVELMEQVRTLLLTEAIHQRSIDQAALDRVSPALARRFLRLQEQLHQLEREPGGTAIGDGWVLDAQAARAAGTRSQRRSALDREWRTVVAEIREAGYPEFLNPVPFARLREAAADGPIAYAFAGEAGCGLLVIHHDAPVSAIVFEGATAKDVFAEANRFRAGLQAATTADTYAGRRAGQQRMSDVLEWLWDTYAVRALAVLKPGAQPRRLWWCPVGVLSYLPLHAAGYHRERAGRTVLDQVISSYTPTPLALLYARRHRPHKTPAVLVVSVPEPAGAAPIPQCGREASGLAAMLPDATLLQDDDAAHTAVLEGLRTASVVHFACHAVVDLTEPSRSRILLADHEANPMTVRSLAQAEAPHGALCYLSACATSDSAPRMADQAVHLTSAFLLVGFRHVVGTMWQVDDRSAARAATGFYLTLWTGQELPVDRAAEGVRTAVTALRDLLPGAPSQWAGYVHAGA
ncbi:CHAT domain-containing protein [Micromonospora sp. NPDC006766]|uniref:CHAT domain-containing protein n=1 Tax=Micromonospora sp. NPDC006766 TaxID=3154778 RepID=UPI0033D8AF99